MANEIETYLKIATIIAGGLFFTWKLVTGWLIINLKLSVALDRETIDNGENYLAIVINLEKGSNDSVWLKDITAKVRTENQEIKIVRFDNELRWLLAEEEKINWNEVHPKGKRLMLSPGETLQISSFAVVPRNEPVLVDVAVFGTRKFWRPGFQWRATAVSLPKTVTSDGR